MSDLSSWDVAIEFTGEEAAALALGIDPAQLGHASPNAKPMLARMKQCYQNKLLHQRSAPPPVDEECPQNQEVAKADEDCMLVSVEHRRMLDAIGWEETGPYASWLVDENRSAFERQKFARKEIIRWLAAIGWNSVYRFDLSSPPTVVPTAPPPSQLWPWGGHQTEALEHLAAAAQEFWSNYDPSNTYKAPKNQTVVAWLKENHKVSDAKANAIATFLRPDDLPTGPRKKK